MSTSPDNKILTKPKIEKTSLAYDEFFKIQRDTLRLPNNHCYSYYTLLTPEHAVNVLGLTDDGKIILLEEYRHPTRQFVLGCPGGYLNHEEDPLIGAKRELLEETGYTAKEFVLMGSAYPYPGISSQKIFFVLGKGAYRQGDPCPDASEIFRTVLKSESEIYQDIQQGLPVDGILCSALYMRSITRAR